MQVRDGMNRAMVTIGPDHSLREAARRMVAADVGAAVVIDPDGPGPGILTERDLLHSNGRDEDLDTEFVRDHMRQRVTYASADWPLELAAELMVRQQFRHVVVLDGSEVVGILSMRDIVRCWTRAGASTPTVRSHAPVAGAEPIGPDGDHALARPDSWQLSQMERTGT